MLEATKEAEENEVKESTPETQRSLSNSKPKYDGF
jgi:hypothetical protein